MTDEEFKPFWGGKVDTGPASICNPLNLPVEKHEVGMEMQREYLVTSFQLCR